MKNLSISRNGVTIGQEERITRSLDGTLPEHIPEVPVGTINNISKARIRRALAELSAGNIDKVQGWLDEVAEGVPEEIRVVEGADGQPITQRFKGRLGDPGQAISLMLQLLEYSIPKLKSVAVSVDDGSGANLKRYTMAELAAKVVSEQ